MTWVAASFKQDFYNYSQFLRISSCHTHQSTLHNLRKLNSDVSKLGMKNVAKTAILCDFKPGTIILCDEMLRKENVSRYWLVLHF
jgi:hypothetical protein